MRKFLFLFMLVAVFTGSYALTIPQPFEMGKPKKQWEADGLKDISNPESWEETKFEYGKPQSVYGIQSQRTILSFWNGRLYTVEMTLPENAWYTLKPILDKEYGAGYVDSTSGYYGSWGEKNQEVTLMQSKGNYTTIYFTDETQKGFHFGDLFKGALLWIIVTIVGLFVLNWFIAWLLTSYCKRCKTFNMKLAGKDLSNLKDYSTEILGSPNMHYDTTYKYKCSKCGHVRKDRYSGFWSYMRSKD